MPPCLIALAIRSIILRLRKCLHKYADPCNGGSCRRLYILSRRDKISRCPRKSIHARTPYRIPPPRLSARVLFARYSSFSSVYIIVALGGRFVNRFDIVFYCFVNDRISALTNISSLLFFYISFIFHLMGIKLKIPLGYKPAVTLIQKKPCRTIPDEASKQ